MTWPARTVLTTALALAFGCGAPSQPRAPAPNEPATDVPPAALHRAFFLHFEGARIGYAVEDERVEGGRRELHRRELVRFRRDEEIATFEIDLLVRGAASGEADEVAVAVRHCTAREVALLPQPRFTALAAPASSAALDEPCPAGATAGPLRRRATARRGALGWEIQQELDAGGTAAAEKRTLPVGAQPAEWLDTRPDRHDSAELQLFFATRGFALGRGARRWLDSRTWLGAVELDGATLESTTALGDDDRPRFILDGNGVTATRIFDEALQQPLDLADLVALTTLAIRGTPPPPGGRIRLRFALRAGAEAMTPPPTSAPGHRLTALPGGWLVELEPPPRRSPADADTVEEIAALAREISGDRLLPAEGADFSDAPDGDCTAYALRFAAAANARGWATRLATGFIVDLSSHPASLVRHRWAVTWTGARWISVDPSGASTGDAPAPPRLLALSLHDATPEALAASEVAFAAVRGASVEWAP